jgi:TetR/AcrR family transcriptional regulator, tetracycline repressor protein
MKTGRRPAGKRAARGRPARDSSAALTREKIVTVALQIVDRDGLAALSMRRLGAELGVDPMAVYHYLPNKAALYDAIVEAVMAKIDLGAGPADGALPVEQLRHMALAYRDALMAHPDALPVVAARPVRTPASLRPIERMLAVIVSMGFTARESIAFVDACGHYIMGWAQTYAAHLRGGEIHDHGPLDAATLPPGEFPNLLRVLREAPEGNPFAVEFEMGLDAFLAGFTAAAERRRP